MHHFTFKRLVYECSGTAPGWVGLTIVIMQAEQTGRWCGQVQYYKIGQQLLLGDGKREF